MTNGIGSFPNSSALRDSLIELHQFIAVLNRILHRRITVFTDNHAPMLSIVSFIDCVGFVNFTVSSFSVVLMILVISINVVTYRLL